jgi:hypothetical protein
MALSKILPGTGRGTATRSVVVEGAHLEGIARRRAPSAIGFADGPPPRAGEELL